MPTDPRGPGADVVSPELVLVASPEDAKRARERLPDRAPALPRRASPPVAASAATRSNESRAPSPFRRKWVRRTAVPIAAALGLAGAVAGGFAGSRGSNDSSNEPRRAAAPVTSTVVGVIPPATKQATTAAKKPTSTTRATPPVATQPVATQPKQPAKSQRKPARTATTKKPARPRTTATGFVPARTWSWQPQAKARRYVFTLTRNGRKVITARTTRPRYILPKRFRFASGRYRWRVVAVRSKRPQRKVLVDSKFVLSRAGADAANG